MAVDGWKEESLHNFCSRSEEQDRPIRSAGRAVLASFRDWDDNG